MDDLESWNLVTVRIVPMLYYVLFIDVSWSTMPDTNVLVDGFGNLVNATTRKEFQIHNDGFDEDEIFHAANHKFMVIL